MGYDLRITRKDWESGAGDDITLAEWLDIVEADPNLTLYLPNGEGFALWKGDIKTALGFIAYSHGELDSKYPVDDLIDKMVEIGTLLGAKVQGDDGEIYVNSEEILEWQAPGVWERRKR
jgi:hypothetical protein